MAHLTWDKIPNARFYSIYVSDDGKNFTPRIDWKINVIDLGGLDNGKTYYYGVESIGFNGQKSEMVVQSVIPNKTSEVKKWMIQLTPTGNPDLDPEPVGKEEWAEWYAKQPLPVIGTPGGIKNPKPQPNPPTNFMIEAGDGFAHMSWDDMPQARGYILFVSEDGQKFKRQFKQPFKKNDITVRLLQNGKTYYFGVECVGPYGEKTKMMVQSVVPTKGKSLK